jgi:circadian clock protein KaiC
MSESADQLLAPERITSGIAGLDKILQGGFLRGGTYLVMGPPGAGKTILSNQICFHHVAGGGRALYLTLLTETTSRMLSNIQNFTFFKLATIGDALS